jgi:hypothetical protein
MHVDFKCPKCASRTTGIILRDGVKLPYLCDRCENDGVLEFPASRRSFLPRKASRIAI